MVTPLITKCFASCGKNSSHSYPNIDEQDEDLVESWRDSLREDMSKDRQSLARLLNNPKFSHGYIEVVETEVEPILRALTEVRLLIRNSKLELFTDVELETGKFSFQMKPRDAQAHYLAYLVLAEIQEGLIAALV